MDDKKELLRLIKRFCRPSKTVHHYSSDGMKSLFELMLNEYLSDHEFKEAMQMAGYKPVDSGGSTFYKVKFVDAPEVPDEFYRGKCNNKKQISYGKEDN